ncbi:hypothetical protein DFH06DRAFT_298806 [Mycena polygramma]|nr:hypothetical protein DFH06DRAFT_298806 [Mycena polygramma]
MVFPLFHRDQVGHSMLPAELVECIVYHAWGCLSTSNRRHAHSMVNWMLVSHEWLNIVFSIVFRDLWITSHAHLKYIVDICRSSESSTSFVCELAGITDVYRHLAQTCRSLTVSVYHKYEGAYTSQCTDLIDYATTDPHRDRLLPGYWRARTPTYAIPCDSLGTFIHSYTPRISSLHFVLVDCNTTYINWNMPPGTSFMPPSGFPSCLVELHVTFAYTSPPPALLLDAARGTFFPPPSRLDLPQHCRFTAVRRLVVRDANADFVAFLTTGCPMLERVESTAKFGVEDVPQSVPADVKARLVFVRLARTVEWGLTSRDKDTVPIPGRVLPGSKDKDAAPIPDRVPDLPVKPFPALRKEKFSLWRVVKRAFRKRKPSPS